MSKSIIPLSPARRAKGLWWDVNYEVLNGCAPVSPGCKNCFSEIYVTRFKDVNPHFEGLIKNGEWTGRVNLRHDKLDMPLKIKKPTTFFVTERGDLFSAPFEFIDKCFAVMALSSQHTFIVLTKRAERMAEYTKGKKGTSESLDCIRRAINKYPYNVGDHTGCLSFPLPNVWLGVTAENQEQADKRIPILLQIPAAVRFVSVEPMLGAIDLTFIDVNGITINALTGFPVNKCRPCGDGNKIDWVICGDESGPISKVRVMQFDWLCSLRDQCEAAGIPFFLKQRRINGKMEKMPKLMGVIHDAMPGVGG